MSKRRKGAERRRKIGKIAGLVALGMTTGGVGLGARAIAKKLIAKNKKKLQRFVVNEGGIVPSENLDELALQTAQVRAKKIEEIKDDPTIDADTTEEASEVFEEQQADDLETESYEGESDAFTEEVMGAVLGVAKGVAKKIRERRAKKGKKSGLLDKLSGVKAETSGTGDLVVSGLTNPKSKDPLSLALNDAKQGAMETTIKQYLPIIVIIVVIAYFVMGKKK